MFQHVSPKSRAIILQVHNTILTPKKLNIDTIIPDNTDSNEFLQMPQ